MKRELEREDLRYEREVLVDEEFVYVCERLLELNITRFWLVYLRVYRTTRCALQVVEFNSAVSEGNSVLGTKGRDVGTDAASGPGIVE